MIAIRRGQRTGGFFMLKEVPGNTNIIINDTNIPDEFVRVVFSRLETRGRATIEIVSGQELSESISSQIRGVVTPNTAVLLPGNGSQQMLKFFDSETISSLSGKWVFPIKTQRYFNGNICTGVSVALPKKLIKNTQNRNYSSLLVIDDVCATGETIQTIRSGLLYELDSPLPPLAWYAIFWLNYIKSDTSGFTANAAVNYKGEKGRVALNSLSTLISEGEKGRIVSINYAQKYFPQQEYSFLNTLSTLKQYD